MVDSGTVNMKKMCQLKQGKRVYGYIRLKRYRRAWNKINVKCVNNEDDKTVNILIYQLHSGQRIPAKPMIWWAMAHVSGSRWLLLYHSSNQNLRSAWWNILLQVATNLKSWLRFKIDHVVSMLISRYHCYALRVCVWLWFWIEHCAARLTIALSLENY